MKYTFLILFILFSSVAGATTYYISPTGSDSNSGSSSSPWKTLSYACSKATVSGDIIHVNAGTYIESSQSRLSIGVSIVGDGVSSVIKSNYVGSKTSGLIALHSAAGNPVNGNQSISYLKLEGNNLLGKSAITVLYRYNVNIHHCTIANFDQRGIAFMNGDRYPNPPAYDYAADNKVYDCIITNCSHMDGGVYDSEYGSVWAFGQIRFLFYNNNCTETSRPVNSGSANGTILKTNWMKAFKVYNNTFTKPDNNNTSWHFFLETWHYEGDCEIYGNTFNGCATVDICDVRPGPFTYGLKIYKNNFLVAAPVASSYHGTQAIDFEEWGAVQSVYVYNNYFKNINTGIQLDALGGNVNDVLINGKVVFKDIYIHYNLFEGVGATNDPYSVPISVKPQGTNNIFFDNINITNNTMSSGTTNPSYCGISWQSGGVHSNIFIRNNIIKGFSQYPIILNYGLAGSSSNFNIQNNLYWMNSSGNIVRKSGVSTTITGSDVAPANPLFISSTDFHLQTGSPAIGKGLTITGMINDLSGNTIKNPPSLGAFENGSSTATTSTAIPVIQTSVVENAAASVLVLTYDLSLESSKIPAATSFSLTVNGSSRPVSAVGITSNKVQLTLSAAIKFGDVITVSYTKPATNPLQTPTGGIAVSFVAKATTNNLVAPTKDALPVAITMSISPRYIHKTISVVLGYSSVLTATQLTALTPQKLRITDTSGKLYVEKLLVSGTTSTTFSLNLYRGYYNVTIFANGVQAATQRIMVY